MWKTLKFYYVEPTWMVRGSLLGFSLSLSLSFSLSLSLSHHPGRLNVIKLEGFPHPSHNPGRLPLTIQVGSSLPGWWERERERGMWKTLRFYYVDPTWMVGGSLLGWWERERERKRERERERERDNPSRLPLTIQVSSLPPSR